MIFIIEKKKTIKALALVVAITFKKLKDIMLALKVRLKYFIEYIFSISMLSVVVEDRRRLRYKTESRIFL